MNEQTFDYVVVGGGSAGSVLGGRLTENQNVTVGILEAGGDGNSAWINVPAGTVAMVPRKLNNWAFDTVPQKGLNGRVGFQPRGKALGGSSAINAMVYIRGNRHDYDHWESLGARGWSFDSVLPYFKLSEHNEEFSGPYHGKDGPLNVARSRTDNPLHGTYLEAAKQAGFPLNDDFNGVEQEGLGVYQLTQQNGERCSAAKAFLIPHIGKRRNLHVETNAHATQVLFDGKRAIGVEYQQGGEVRRFMARREVILSAGALQTPQLLLRSGVGPAEHLNALGIPVVHDASGVGENLQDHPDFVFGYRTTTTNAFGVSAGGALKLAGELLRYQRERRGFITSNFAECGGFLRSQPGLFAPDIQLHFVVALVENHARTMRLGHGISCHVCLLRPRSRGWVRLDSTDPLAPPMINPGFFENPADLEDMVAGFKMTRRLMKAPAMQKVLGEDLVTAGIESDEQIRNVLRNRADTIYHPVGTCRMGVDAKAVVDPELRVIGLDGLRVVDASVMPTLVSGNTNAPTIMIAEKAVDLILGINRVR